MMDFVRLLVYFIGQHRRAIRKLGEKLKQTREDCEFLRDCAIDSDANAGTAQRAVGSLARITRDYRQERDDLKRRMTALQQGYLDMCSGKISQAEMTTFFCEALASWGNTVELRINLPELNEQTSKVE
jgi:hypothetical protein